MSVFVKQKSFYKKFFTLTIILALQNLIIHSVSLADNIMLGGYSEVSLSAVALANQIQFLLQMLVLGIGGGMMVISSQYWGKKQIEPIKKITNIGVKLSIIVSILLFLVIFFFPRQCVSLLTNDLDIINESIKYLRIICFSYVLFAITNSILAMLRSIETVKVGFVVSLFALVVNVFLNYVLIYGNFGAPELGTRGAAIATLSARIVEFIVVFVYCRFLDKKIKIRLKDFGNIDLSLLKNYIKIGLPTIGSDALWGVAMCMQAAILGHIGGEAIAANSISNTIFQIVTVVCYASGNASSIIVGKTIGENRIDDVKKYVKTLQVLYVFIGIATSLVLLLSNNFILSFYNISESTRNMAYQFTIVLSISVLGTSYECPTLIGIIRGGGSTKFVLLVDMLFMWLLALPSAMIAAFVFHLPPVVVFAFIKADQLLKCIVAYLKVNKGSWIRQLT